LRSDEGVELADGVWGLRLGVGLLEKGQDPFSLEGVGREQCGSIIDVQRPCHLSLSQNHGLVATRKDCTPLPRDA